MPGKQARVLCPVCQDRIPPDETECMNCGAFVIDEAVVRLSRALGLDREKALKLFDAGFRHPSQLRDRDPEKVLAKGEVGLLFICTNCGSFVSGADSTCPRCAVEFEGEVEEPTPEGEDILDLVLCPVCGADNDPDLAECEICGGTFKADKETEEVPPEGTPELPPVPEGIEEALQNVDQFVEEPSPKPAAPPALVCPESARPMAPPPEPKPEPALILEPPPTPVPTEPRTEPLPRMTLGPPSPSRTVAAPAPKPRAIAKPVPRPPPKAPLAAVRPADIPKHATVQQAPARIPRAILIPRKTVRRVRPPPPGAPPETIGGLVLAGGAGLLLAGALGQRPVSAGIAVFLTGFAAYVLAGFLRRRTAWPPIPDRALLIAGAFLGLLVPAIQWTSAGMSGAVAVAAAAVVPLGWATRRLLREPQRVLLAVAGASSIVGQAVGFAADPAYGMTAPWIIGILAAMPWPAALAGSEILRRQSTTVLRRQLARAERNVERREYERSLAEYDRAIAVARTGVPGAEIPWYGKGATLVLLGRYEEALRAIDTALDINPHNEVAWVNKGNALTKMGRHLDALRCFNAAIKVNPVFEVAWNNKGNALARLGKFEESLRCYERALEIDPGYRGAWMNKGFVLTKLGRFDEAASCADHVLRLQDSRRAEPA